VAPAVVDEVARAPFRFEHLVDTPGAAGLLRAGEVIEFGETDDIFNRPKDGRTEDYITGRFG